MESKELHSDKELFERFKHDVRANIDYFALLPMGGALRSDDQFVILLTVKKQHEPALTGDPWIAIVKDWSDYQVVIVSVHEDDSPDSEAVLNRINHACGHLCVCSDDPLRCGICTQSAGVMGIPPYCGPCRRTFSIQVAGNARKVLEWGQAL